MGKISEYVEYRLELNKNTNQNENMLKIISEFEKLCSGEISEEGLYQMCKIVKKYGLSFVGEVEEKELGRVSFDNLSEFKKFCEMLTNITSTYDEKSLPIIKYNDIADPYPFFSYSDDGVNYKAITREEFKVKFPEYPLGNVDVKPVIRCIYGDLSDVDVEVDKLYMDENLEINYYGYNEKGNFKPGYVQADFGYLVTIAGNQVFVYTQEELKELLNSLLLGEEELCEEKVFAKKQGYDPYNY